MLKETLINPDNPKVDVSVRTMHRSIQDFEPAPTADIRKILSYIGAAYFLIMTALVIPVACFFTVLLISPLIYFRLPLFNLIEHYLCGMVNAHWSACSVFCGAQVTEFGADVSKVGEEKCLLLANHLGLLDHFILMQSLDQKGSIRSRWMWVIYNIWKYTPIGVMWTTHGNFFVNGGASKRHTVLQSFRQHLKDRFHKFDYGWVIMYPEGSRLFLVKDSGRKFAEKNNLVPLENCVYPRTGAAHAVLDVLGPQNENYMLANCGSGTPIRYIIDATIGYSKGIVPDMGGAMIGEWPTEDSSNFAVHYEIIPVKPEWSDEKELQKFLYERYQLKDTLLDNFYKTGVFPGEQRKVTPNFSEACFSQVFWIVLYYFHYTIWLLPLIKFLCNSIWQLIF
ncbi:unnamed protein product [Caenorhabditis bovis]|uniref:Phospholipid/glycerol acyltransferase domain-containing protein n=1 Tax=Caenorhabditis bovis TaxID=2654633 RepID=A0A8S1EK56_9PELO|nr:unnamed protein product [Caenorhabditis bovis]